MVYLFVRQLPLASLECPNIDIASHPHWPTLHDLASNGEGAVGETTGAVLFA